MSIKKPVKKAAKKVTTKQVVAKKAVKSSKTKTSPKSTGNKELDKMLTKIETAKKNGEKSVIVFTTSKSSHKANKGNSFGFGASDLKPSLLSAYKYLSLSYDVDTRLVNPDDMAVEWIVKIKK